jgi:hypothetical protein
MLQLVLLRLGMSMLRPLLRSEIGEVANRRAWWGRYKFANPVDP